MYPSLHTDNLLDFLNPFSFSYRLSSSPRSVSGLDKEPDLVHMEAHTPDGSESLQRIHVHSYE